MSSQRIDPPVPADPSDIDWKAAFAQFYEAVAQCEAPRGTQVDDVLAEAQATYARSVER